MDDIALTYHHAHGRPVQRSNCAGSGRPPSPGCTVAVIIVTTGACGRGNVIVVIEKAGNFAQ